MRVKTENRRQAIIEVATEVFHDVGFERASMDVIARRLGGSKATLYGYFKSKDELFETAMRAAGEAPGDQIMSLLDPDSADLHATLERFAHAYLNFILGKDVLAVARTAVSQGANSPLGPHLYKQGPARGVTMFTKFFSELIARGRLRAADPLAVSLSFKGLIEGSFLEASLYGAEPLMERSAAVSSAVDVFLRAYQVVEDSRGTPDTRAIHALEVGSRAKRARG